MASLLEKARKAIEAEQIPADMLNRDQAAAHIGLGLRWLDKMRRQKRGPPHKIMGNRNVYYLKADLDAWMAEFKERRGIAPNEAGQRIQIIVDLAKVNAERRARNLPPLSHASMSKAAQWYADNFMITGFLMEASHG